MRIDMSDALYLQLEAYELVVPLLDHSIELSEHPGRAGLVHAIQGAEKRQRKRGGGRVRTSWRMELSADVEAWMVTSALPNAIEKLKDHGTSGSPQEAGHVAGALKAARSLLAKLEATTGIRPATTDAERYPNQQPAGEDNEEDLEPWNAGARKKAPPAKLEAKAMKVPNPAAHDHAADQERDAKRERDLKAKAKANRPTKQQRRKAAAQEADNGEARMGVPRMAMVFDRTRTKVNVSVRRAGVKDGRIQYYARILRTDGGLVRERMVDGVAGYQRLLAGIARGRDSQKDPIPTMLGTQLLEEGMEL